MRFLNEPDSEPYVTPPQWAVMMRRILDAAPSAIETVLSRYVQADGSLLWPANPNHQGVDALDDAYESFQNWPLLHLLGADDTLLEKSQIEFDAITKQFARYATGHGHPMVVQEYEQGYDWFHQGEGYLFFYHLCATRPDFQNNVQRAARYAGFLMNEGTPEDNYDFKLKQFRCPHIGSMGPAFRNFSGAPRSYEGWMVFYGLPFQEFPDCRDPERYFQKPEHAGRLGRLLKERLSHGDVAVNLASTTMAANAYMLTGEEKYRTWALDYINGWFQRAAENGGVLPDNVGPSGVVGECQNGNTYGGNYGWTWPHGWESVGEALLIASQNALLLSGDPAYLDLFRSHLHTLVDRAIDHNNTLHVPHKQGDPGWYGYNTSIPNLEQVLRDENDSVIWKNGWFEFQPMDPAFPVKLWELSQQPADLELIRRLRNHQKPDWQSVNPTHAKDLGGHESAFAAYLAGEYPEYPEAILGHNLDQMQARLDFIEKDQQDPVSYSDSYLQKRNPISAEGLVQLTLGGTLPAYNGGLPQTRLRYFDPMKRRSGLPKGVAALIESMDADHVVISLVNLNRAATPIVIQGGCFAEHTIQSCTVIDNRNDTEFTVDDPLLQFSLAPQSITKVRLVIRRFVNRPVSRMPW